MAGNSAGRTGEIKMANWEVGTLKMNDGAVAVVDRENEMHIAFVTCQSVFKRGQGYLAECAERDSNAKLIAAAPDLLEALEALVAGADAMGWNTDAAHRAVAKATV